MRTALNRVAQATESKSGEEEEMVGHNRSPVLDELASRAAKFYAQSVGAWMACAEVLLEARNLAAHGEWLPFLEAAGIPERTAQRMIAVARAGFKSDTVSDFGVGEVLDLLAKAGRRDRRKVAKMANEVAARLHENATLAARAADLDERVAIIEADANADDPVYRERLERLVTKRAEINELTEKLHMCQSGRVDAEAALLAAERQAGELRERLP